MEEQFIESYKILKKIGAGGMAKVYLAVHKDVPNLKVILKILSDPRLGERFRQEADKLALLDGHPNICRINHFFSHGDDTVIVMEYINGSTLDEILEEKGRLSVEETLRITDDVLDTLSFAHEKGVSHRDIKPSNIMLDSTGKVKIIDFGIAKGKSDPQLTAAGMACGTPAYMAPEQFTPTEDTDYTLVDIYAVGTTLYKMLTGACPFEGDNEFAIRDAKLFNDPAGPRTLNADIPKPLEKIILKCLEKEPSKRYQSIREVQQALQEIQLTGKKESSGTDKTVPVSSSDGIAQKPSGNKKPLFIGLAVVVVAVVIFGVMKFSSGDKVVSSDSGSISDTTGKMDNTNQPGQATTTPPPVGEVFITVTPRADAIYFDDSLLQGRKNSALITCDTGQHVLRIKNKKAVKRVLVDTIQVSSDKRLEKSYVFTFPVVKTQQKPATPPPKPVPDSGYLVAASIPRGADVFIDGVHQPQRTVFRFKVKTGKHIVSLRLQDQKYLDTVLVTKDGETRVFYEFKE